MDYLYETEITVNYNCTCPNSCLSNTHDCICDTNYEICDTIYHQCICNKNVEVFTYKCRGSIHNICTCMTVYNCLYYDRNHKCNCKSFGPEHCLSNNHNCICDEHGL